MIKICEYCHIEFNAKKQKNRFCSKSCAGKSRNGKNITLHAKNCEYCCVEFKTIRKKKRFCSSVCANKNRSTAIRKECLYCGKEFITIPSQIENGGGKYCSHKCSCLNNRKDFKPVKDRRKTVAYKEFKMNVLERDNWTCQKCLVRGGKLEVHHIKSYVKHKELQTKRSNGITFCHRCHKEFHTLYGAKRSRESDTHDFIKN